MDRIRVEASEADRREQQIIALACRHFLRDYEQAAARGYESAKVGWAQTGHQKYKGEMQYWRDVQRAIRWLLHHIDRWSANHVTETSHVPITEPTESGD